MHAVPFFFYQDCWNNAMVVVQRALTFFKFLYNFSIFDCRQLGWKWNNHELPSDRSWWKNKSGARPLMRHSVSEIMYFQMNAFKYWFIIDIDLFIDIDWLILMMTFDIWNPLHIFSARLPKSKFRVVIMYTSFWRKKKMMPHCRSVNCHAVWLSRKVFSSLEKERKITLGKPFSQYNKCNLRIQFEFITTTLPAWRRFPAVILN